jgi:hypothetical protein
MAKIISVGLLSIPDVINVGDNISDITVVTKIEFHDIDIKLQMEYCLHIFVYDIHGEMDTPLVVANWDETKVFPISASRKDVFLGEKKELLTANEKNIEILSPIALHLGKFNKQDHYVSRKIEAFATLTPAIGRASKWSEPFTAQIVY